MVTFTGQSDSRLQQNKMCWSSAANPDLEVEWRVKSEGDMFMFVFLYSETKTIVQLKSSSWSLDKMCP